MKKYLSLLLIVLMMFTVLFVSISCNNQPSGETTPELDAATKAEKTGKPILPIGTGITVPTWEGADENGAKNLPAFVTNGSKTNVSDELKAAIKAANENPNYFDSTPKNVILIISDGMGTSHLNMSREYKGELVMDLLPYITESTHKSYVDIANVTSETKRDDKVTTDSSAGGTQILCGYKTRYGYIGVDIDANPVQNLSEVAKANGWKIGVITNDHIGDSTPASTLVHNTLRYHQQVIAFQELMLMLDENSYPDLLMGSDWNMDCFFEAGTWAERLLKAEKESVADARDRNSKLPEFLADDTPSTYYSKLSADQKTIYYPFSVYYYIWDTYTEKTTAFEDWVAADGPSTWANANLPADLSTRIKRYEDFKLLAANTDFSLPILGSYAYSGAKTLKSFVGYQEYSEVYPNFSEMVAYTLYQLDKEATAADTGFFCMIENTYTDGWGHKQLAIGVMNEVQNTDEGVAIAVKYVLEHPDTLLVVTADHETGGFKLKNNWQYDISQIKSGTSGHSDITVPCIAFGAGADKFSAEAIGEKHEGYVTGQVLGRLMQGGNYAEKTFGQGTDYPGTGN